MAEVVAKAIAPTAETAVVKPAIAESPPVEAVAEAAAPVAEPVVAEPAKAEVKAEETVAETVVADEALTEESAEKSE